jgi:hypothetical protein
MRTGQQQSLQSADMPAGLNSIQPEQQACSQAASGIQCTKPKQLLLGAWVHTLEGACLCLVSWQHKLCSYLLLLLLLLLAALQSTFGLLLINLQSRFLHNSTWISLL